MAIVIVPNVRGGLLVKLGRADWNSPELLERL
jgi:hypothetical protein